jgi:AcrR family transcriptional regulator
MPQKSPISGASRTDVPGPSTAELPAAAPGLRERRRRQTRAEISQAALRLFQEYGVDATTVDGIANAAGISQRTFFRYFTSKEEAALPAHQDFDAALEAGLLSIDPAGNPREELERVYQQVMQGYADNDAPQARSMLLVNQLIRKEPLLRAALLKHNATRTTGLVDALMDRFGRDGISDLQIRLAFETCAAVVRVAFEVWVTRREAGRNDNLPDIYASARQLAH